MMKNYMRSTPMARKKWSFETGGVIYASPSIGTDGTIYIGSTGGVSTQSNRTVHKNGNLPQIAGYKLCAIGVDGTIYVGSMDSKIYALNPDGIPKWNFTTGLSIYSSPAIDSNGTYISAPTIIISTHLILMVQKNGIYRTGAEVSACPVIGADDTIYVSSNDGKLYNLGSGGPSTLTLTAPMAAKNGLPAAHTPLPGPALARLVT